jgi:hypothetical protein
MRSRWAEVLALAGSLCGAAPAAAQQGSEIGVQAIATASQPAIVVAGAYGALRTSARTRVSAAAGAGISDGDFAAREELLGHFLLSPGQPRGAGFYLAGGLAAVQGPVSRGYVVLTAGLEERPAAGSGWSAELGVGGGVRVALGYRWRWFRQPGPP